MTSPHEDKLSHPLEQVTGEKDVHPEEEGAPRRERTARSEDERPGTDRDRGAREGSPPSPEDSA
ncbi:hypothetical protein GTU99_13815 [Streptomyces sp. PRKS01-65]|nr:hypothetical protein [Streptomyces harenosi]NEY33254.1 hypothetical protein [Streptomyces harenosi]